MEYYLEVVENNSYTQAVFKKAKEYFEKRPMEWQYLCHTTPEKMLAQSMIVSYENTSEGEAFRKEWYEKARNNTKRWYIFIFLCISDYIVKDICEVILFCAVDDFFN
jgi:hypothetical protein